MTDPVRNEAVQRAIDKLGSGSALAKALDRSPQFISQLLRGERYVPAELCPIIERETGVRCEELRPDVQWAVLRQGDATTSSDAPGLSERAAAFAGRDRRTPEDDGEWISPTRRASDHPNAKSGRRRSEW